MEQLFCQQQKWRLQRQCAAILKCEEIFSQMNDKPKVKTVPLSSSEHLI